MANLPKIGISLGSGLARGLAHIGVIKVFAQAGLKIDCIAGSGMGGIVASLYASNFEIKLMERLARSISRRTWMDFTFPRMGLIAGERLEELMYLLTGRRAIEDLNLPLALSTTDLCTGEQVLLRRGCIARAVRASCAVPGIFSPVRLQGRILADGGIIERVPVNAVQEMGAELVVAVDVGYYVAEYKISHIFDVMAKTIDIMSREICQKQLDRADVLIAPDLRDIGPFHFHRVQEIIHRGEEAARAALPLIQSKLEKEG
ncbi:MAG TPA: patatin-like phospholipase family protein [Bacillota bacterium]|nr:patatin-like phospholipase family protein [Bacillota bacterium]